MDYAPAPVPEELRERYRRFGHHTDLSITTLMLRNREEFGARAAVLDGDVVLSWRELVDDASRVAGFLQAHGIGPGDTVVWQVPNWWEALVVAYGIWAVGAVSSPVVTIYREFELANIVAAVRPSVVIAAREFRGRDHVDMLEAACTQAGVEPPVRVCVRGTAPGWTTFEDALKGTPFIADPVDLDAPALVGWTSGTTSGAKGVAHSIRTFLTAPLRAARYYGTRWEDRNYMPAPIAHATGLLACLGTPVVTGSSTVIRDSWDAERALDDIRAYGVTTTSGASVFLRELVGAVEARGLASFPLARGYTCGGASVPQALAERADALGLLPARVWGLTEMPVATTSSPLMAPKRIRCETDGYVVSGCELRFLAPDGTDVASGEPGEIVVRGPQRALGYLDPAHTRDAFDDEGWFRTGDVGVLDDEGAVTITGRVKEIINRGGEKLSSREIEEAIAFHPAVREVAVVPTAHERLGEQPAAFVIVRAHVSPAELADHLRARGLAPQKIPQLWRFVDELPRTASGKVTKYVLEQRLADEGRERVAQ